MTSRTDSRSPKATEMVSLGDGFAPLLKMSMRGGRFGRQPLLAFW